LDGKGQTAYFESIHKHIKREDLLDLL